MDFVVVEPRDGDELDRFITVLLNVTGVIHQVLLGVREDFGVEGIEVIDTAAERLREIFCVLAEQYDDDDLAALTGALAFATLLIADELGIRSHFTPVDDPFDHLDSA